MSVLDDDVKRSFVVEIERVKVHRFTVDNMNSPEEAEQVAEDMLLEGEEGSVLVQEVTNVDSYVADPKEDTV